jgi:hypothetical protein
MVDMNELSSCRPVADIATKNLYLDPITNFLSAQNSLDEHTEGCVMQDGCVHMWPTCGCEISVSIWSASRQGLVRSRAVCCAAQSFKLTGST